VQEQPNTALAITRDDDEQADVGTPNAGLPAVLLGHTDRGRAFL
jgi:hypothetical protein